LKLVIIGGASAYTPDIIAGLLKERETFAGCELALQDIHEPNLALIARLARGMVRASGAEIRVTATVEREEAIKGASFILTQPRIGGLKARALDERIPLKYGVIGQETLGPGGLSFAWRTIPLMLEIVAECQRWAPEAWVINYANPAGMVTEAVIQRFPGARYIGLCDMPTGVQWAIGKLLRVDYHRIDLDYAGINHCGWSGRVLLDGEDILERLYRWAFWLGPVAGILPLTEETGTLRLFREQRLVPDPYLRYYYYRDRVLRKLQRTGRTRAEELIEKLPRLYGHYEAAGAADQPVLTMHRGHPSHSDLASQVIASMAAGRRRRFVIQQRNGGAVPNLPAAQAAQFPAWVSAAGFERIPVQPLPDAAAPLIAQVKESEMLNVEATLKGDRKLAIEAAAANPLVVRRSLAEPIISELLRAHAPYLPQFGH
jgi:6-phospho-beta-glucosidase